MKSSEEARNLVLFQQLALRWQCPKKWNLTPVLHCGIAALPPNDRLQDVMRRAICPQ